ncbi:esterase-like activity of phytase family protein [Corynebacterium sp. 335C]
MPATARDDHARPSTPARAARPVRRSWRTSPAVAVIAAAAILPVAAAGAAAAAIFPAPGSSAPPSAAAPGPGAAAPDAAFPQAAGWTAEPLGTIDLGRAPVAPAVADAVGDAPFGGISGLEHLGGDRYLALSDDRADRGPARAYKLTLPLDDSGAVDAARASVDGAITLTGPDGAPYGKNSVDPESIRVLPGGELAWTSEGGADSGIAPAVVAAGADGRELRRFDVPAHHLPGDGRGVRDNLAYEGLTLLGDGRAATLVEAPLAQDGPVPAAEPGSPARLTIWDVATGAPVAEHVYPLDGVPAGSDERGASEILAAGDDALIVLERSWIPGQGTVGRLSVVTPDGADDVLSAAALTGDEATVVKHHLLDLSPNGENVDNVEAMAWGPELADGRRVLLIATDDNFNPGQRSLVHAVAVGMPG